MGTLQLTASALEFRGDWFERRVRRRRPIAVQLEVADITVSETHTPRSWLPAFRFLIQRSPGRPAWRVDVVEGIDGDPLEFVVWDASFVQALRWQRD